MKKIYFKLDFGIFLLITGALANVTLWIGAFVSTEAAGPISQWVRDIFLPILGGISGLAMGITIAAGLVYVLGRLSKLKPMLERKMRGTDKYKEIPNIRFWGAAVAISLLLIISPALLAPYVYMTISNAGNLFEVLGQNWAGIWSVGRIVAADLALAAVALVHGVQLGASGSDGHPARSGAVRSGARRTPKRANRTAAEVRKCNVPGCEMTYRWPQGRGAHMKKHHPELCIRKGIPAQVALPIRQESKK